MDGTALAKRAPTCIVLHTRGKVWWKAGDVRISDDIRAALGLGAMEWSLGDWFCLDHELVTMADGLPFAHKSGGDGRRTVVVIPSGPNALIYPRSRQTWSDEGHPHDGHAGRCERHSCKVTCFGHVLVTVPVRVDAENLDDSTYSCTEPEGPLLDFLGRTRRL